MQTLILILLSVEEAPELNFNHNCEVEHGIKSIDMLEVKWSLSVGRQEKWINEPDRSEDKVHGVEAERGNFWEPLDTSRRE